jgi:hypothetical protein
MSDFDPAKEAKNLQNIAYRSRVGLILRISLSSRTIASITANLDIALTVISTALLIAWFSLFAMSDTGRSAFDAHMQRK